MEINKLKVKIVLYIKGKKKTIFDNNFEELNNVEYIENIKILIYRNKNDIITKIFGLKRTKYFIEFHFKYEHDKFDIYSYQSKEDKFKTYYQNSKDGQHYPVAYLYSKEDNDDSIIILSSPPHFSNNNTFQTYDGKNKKIILSTGTNRKEQNRSWYRKIKKNEIHDFYLFTRKRKIKNQNNLDVRINRLVYKNFCLQKVLKKYSFLNSFLFSNNYYLIRKNHRHESNYFIIPHINYSGKQYLRDAFHQTTTLPDDLMYECYKAVYPERFTYAENPFLYILWSYRVYRKGYNVNFRYVKKAFNFIKRHTKNGWYIPPQYQSGNNLGWKSWFDTFYFDKDDSPAYTQSLYYPALLALKNMGFSVINDYIDLVMNNYISLYNPEKKYIRFSRKLNHLSVDVLVGELFSYIYFNKKVLTPEIVTDHYNTLLKSKTKYGFKNIATLKGNYLEENEYGEKNPYVSLYGKGNYQFGGSWFLYDMMMLLAVFIHGIDTSEEMLWRTNIEFKDSLSLAECLSTIDGKPEKQNQGWNVSPFVFYSTIMNSDNFKPAINFLERINKDIRKMRK